MLSPNNGLDNLFSNQRIAKNKQTEIYLTMLVGNFPEHGLLFSTHRKVTYANGTTDIPGSAFTDIAQAAQNIQWWAGKGHDTYFAMGGEKEVKKSDKPRRYPLALRKKSNVGMCSSVYLDIDVKDGAYTTQNDALISLRNFIKKYKLPMPSLIVSSGTGGVHVYWATHELFTPAEHNALSFSLIVMGQEFGLHFDPECTKDVCRLLRPPGTWNFKTDPASAVELLSVTERLPLETLRKRLKIGNTTRLPKKPDAAITPAEVDENDDLMRQKKEYPLADFNEVETYCEFLRNTKATGGRGHSEAIWKQTVSLASYCVDGRELAHKLSKDHPAYERGETDLKYEQVEIDRKNNAKLGPSKCYFLRHTLNVRECETCPHFALNTTPINVPSFQQKPGPQTVTPRVTRDILNVVSNILGNEESQDERIKYNCRAKTET